MTRRIAGEQEKRLLLACIPPDGDSATLRQLVRDPQVNWQVAHRLADRHKMVGIVAPVVHGLLNGDVPKDSWMPWLAQWRALVMQDLLQLVALEEILAASQEHGLRPMLLKGFSLHLQAYPQETARGSSDIDLLVRQSEISVMARCLEALGFAFDGKDSRGRPLPHWSSLLARTNEAPFHRPTDKVTVEIHWSLCPSIQEYVTGLSLSDQIWNETRQISLGRVDCTIPGREEELLFLCLHLLKSGPFHLRGLCDLVRMIEVSSPPIRWDRLLERARSTGTAAAAYYGFELATEVRPGAVPDFVHDALRLSSGPRWLLAPSLRLDRLLETQGEEFTNVGLRWRGIFFAKRPWLMLPFHAALYGKRLLREIQAVLT